jgi:nucleotide-binding universal stress UspA family protein
MRTIVVPVDFSTATARVCDAACALAKLIRARLLLLHVVQPPTVLVNNYYAFDATLMAGAVAAGEQYAARKLRTLLRRCTRQRVAAKVLHLSGRPVADILARAAATKAAYIVIGSHGHTAAYDLLVGSTTQGVLRRARCPVVVVPMTPR